MQVIPPVKPKKKEKKSKRLGGPIMFAEPMTPSNSFVGTEEYIAPVRIGHPLLSIALLCLVI